MRPLKKKLLLSSLANLIHNRYITLLVLTTRRRKVNHHCLSWQSAAGTSGKLYFSTTSHVNFFLKALKAKAWLYNNRSCASWEIAETVKFQEKQWLGRRRKSFSFHQLRLFFLFIFSDISGQSCCPLKTNYLQSVKIMANHTNVRFIKTNNIKRKKKTMKYWRSFE